MKKQQMPNCSLSFLPSSTAPEHQPHKGTRYCEKRTEAVLRPSGDMGTEFRHILFYGQTGRRMAQKTTERRPEVPAARGTADFHTEIFCTISICFCSRASSVFTLHVCFAYPTSLWTWRSPKDVLGKWHKLEKWVKIKGITGEKMCPWVGIWQGFCMTTASSELSVYPFTLHQAYTSGHSVMKDVLSLSVLIFCMLLPLYSVHNIRTICLTLRPFFFIWSSRPTAKLQSEDWEISNHKTCRHGSASPEICSF